MWRNRVFLMSSKLKKLPSLWNSLLLIATHCLLYHSAESRSPSNRNNCRDLYTYHSIRNSGRYSIDVDGDGPLTPITVECDMGDGKDPHQILTIVHHNAENTTDVRGYEAAGSYVLNISYVGVTEAHLMALIDNSFSCQQYIKWACKGSMFGFWYPPDIDSWWVGRNWKKQYYWGGAETDSKSCGCHPYCQKTERNSTCNCDANDKQKWFEDSGLLLDSSRLPVLQLSFGDTGESNEAGQHTLGALVCRAVGHRDVYKGTFHAPVQLTTPGYERGEYPPPFHRYTWSVKVPEGATMELVFPDYDVVHYGSYNSVPECKNVVTVLAAEDSAGEKHLIVRQKTPPYYASEGSQTTVNITLTTCNQDSRVPLGRGFKAYVRRTECGGCNPGRGKNGDTTYCSGVCGIIASEEYPFPHHFYPFPHRSSEAYNYNHTWILRVFQHYVVELEFSDFDIPAHPGARNCTPDRGVLWIYNGEHPGRENLIGGFCNLNRQGKVYSNTNTMTLVFAMRWQKVGNGRGFYAIYKGVVQPITPESAFTKELSNVALGKPAKQSSTLDGRNAENAVDNNTDPTLLSKTCVATKPGSEPWWQVDLQKRYLIYGIEIYSTKSEDQLRAVDSEKTWPTGQYGIPMAVSGCPSSRGFEWKTGYRYQDMNYDIVQDKKIHHWTNGMLLKGGLQKTSVGGVQQKSGVMQYFCMKAQNTTTAETHEWEPGAYCVFQYGENCPAGFHSGFITWSDTRSNRSDSTLYGHTPKGRYTAHTTTIYFCCRIDGNPDIPIKLPSSQPFYLLRYGKSCQKVEGMTETEQFFHFNEDQPRYGPLGKDSLIGGNPKYGYPHPKIDKDLFDRGIAVYYCYYDISRSLRGFRVTVDEVGLIWTYGRFHDDLSYGIPHSVEGNFLNAYTCMVYPVTEPEFSVLKVNCSQPIYGQFVTLQVFNRHDSLQFCEMKVFGTESCGQPLGMASEEIYDEQINATSSDDTDHHYYTNGRLNAKYGWCASFNDSDKEFMVDLQNMTTVTGIIFQGLNGAQKKVNVKEFYLLFSNDSVSWIWEEEPVGQQKVYICEQCESMQYVNDLSVRYNLLKGISTRFVMVKILNYREEPCLRLEIIGCREKVDCVKNIQMPPFQGVIKSPNHPNYYGQDKSCWWHINPNPGKHIELNFVVFDLAEKEENLLAGQCRDELTVYSGYPNSTAIRSPDGRLFPKRIISNGPLKVHLQSCFRYSLSRYRGFYAYYKSADCPGCGIGDFNCPDVHMCKSKCGEIVSIGHPLPYQNNHRCRWLIEALPSEFINLTFLDFDIVGGETCLHDYLDVYDGNTSLRSNLIGRFCNAKLPPPEIVSSWNTLLIEFSSDAEEAGRGFALKYVSQSFQLPVKIYDYDDPLACEPPWKYYEGHCYNAFHENDALQWYEAEGKCKFKAVNQKGHLVSILDKKENAVVHFFLTNFWNAQHKSLYIGLNDELKEGSYRWSDDNPMIYTDWAPAGRSLRTQPDGGAYQDCTMLRVDSGHSTAHWHDIPCSLGKLSFYNWDGIDWGKNDESDDQHAAGEKETLLSISSYICKMKSERQGGVNQLQKPIPAQIEATGTTPGKVDLERYYPCRNREMISTQFVCDRKEDCRDGSDEETCPRDSCPVSSFRCGNGRCVSIAAYCDFKDDCGDQSDESRCDHRECGKDEFQCRNGQCIPSSQRCDLFYNCYDKSDEHECRGKCNHNSTFQCYDGTCIPRYTLCDGHRDCPGKYHEDEQYGCSRREDRTGKKQEKNLCSNRARKTCEDLMNLDNIRESGYYYIDPDELDGEIKPFKVYCNMEDKKYGVKTVIHHDSEDEIYVRSGTDGPGSYTRRIVYSVGMEKVKALTNISKYCHQFVSWKCQGTGFSFDTAVPVSWWTSWDGKPQYTWGGAKENATCGCYPNCTDPRRPCNCDSVRRFSRSEDSGYLNDKGKLPIREVRFGNTFRTGQSGYHRIGPLECFGNAKEANEVCRNTTDFMRCHTGHYVPVVYQCKYEFDQYQYHIGCRDVTHLRNCETFQCPLDYIKCPESYCIPTRYVCDGKWDCIGGGDEIECDSYNCPGQYKCYSKSNCLPLHQLCDGIRQCPEGDDELFCDLVCPDGCICVGLYVSCMHQNVSASSRLPDNIPLGVRKLDFSFNRIDLKTANFNKYKELGELILQYNYLTMLPPKKFIELRNLYKLDLSNNRLTHISALAFEGLKNLRLLHLENNPTITEIESEAFAGLSNLPSLNLTGMSLKVLRKHTFSGMSRLRYLNLRNNMIKKVEDNSFNSLHSVTVLDIRGNDIVDFSSYIFTGLKSLDYLYSDSFTFCCMALPQVPPANCAPPPDEISSCTDLMSSLVQRSFLWVLGIIALLGNLFVVVWRIKMKDSNRISSTLILSLGFADFLMGVYLIIIASVDVHYRGQYIENSDNWRKSTLCKICGFLSTVSSEVSILTLLSITLDRLICLCFPLSQKRFSLQFTYKLIFISWVIAAVIAIIPLVVEPYFEGRYYARSGVCLALHITSHRATGWEYSVATFFCVNLLAFIAIVAAYTYMYFTIRRSYHNMNRLMARQSTESKIGLQMALIVLTNSLCWFPIILMGLMAMSGMKVSGEAYAWIAVFVLPLNSATNPLIYTVSSLHFYTRMLSRFGLNSKDIRSSYVSKLTNSTARADQRMKEQLDSRPFKPPHGYVPMLQFLRTVPQLSPTHLLRIATAVCRTLRELHAGSYALGGIDVNAIFVSEPKGSDEDLQVYVPDFNAYKIVNPPINGVPDDTAVDMEEFGLLVKKMLRVYHVMSRSNDPMQGTAC